MASSNFVNVVGAIMASFLLWMLVKAAAWGGITQAVQPNQVVRGELIDWDYKKGRPARLEVLIPDQPESFQKEAREKGAPSISGAREPADL